jgi:hypothetical protein
MNDNLPARRSTWAPGWYPCGTGGEMGYWDGAQWTVVPTKAPKPQRSSAMTTWRTWCIIWAIVWFVAGFLFLPLWILSLMSVGAALIPWGGDSR